MTQLVWDAVSTRFYELGIDRGVLYLSDLTGVAWNGLKSVVETNANRTLTPLYHEGLKYGDSQTTADYTATLKALTYPDEFEEYQGAAEYDDGIFLKNQYLKRFHLSYRTRVGNDIDASLGYKIHILYNLLAIPQDVTYETLNSSAVPADLGWVVSGVPEVIEGYVPTAHIVLDSTKISAPAMEALEAYLYGTVSTPPMLLKLADIYDVIHNYTETVIIDNGDGTWSATGSDYNVMETSDTEFEIVHADVTYSDEDTYMITTGLE